MPPAKLHPRLLMAVGLVGATAGAVLVSPLGWAIADLGSPPAPPAVAQIGEDSATGPDDTSPSAPTLTADQQQAASQIALADPAVQSLVPTRHVSMLIVPWTASDGRSLGAGIDIKWRTPLAVSATWPTMVYDATETVWPPYQTTTATITATDVTGVHVAVDLNVGKVIAIEALPGAHIASVQVAPGFQNTLPPQPTTPQ